MPFMCCRGANIQRIKMNKIIDPHLYEAGQSTYLDGLFKRENVKPDHVMHFVYYLESVRPIHDLRIIVRGDPEDLETTEIAVVATLKDHAFLEYMKAMDDMSPGYRLAHGLARTVFRLDDVERAMRTKGRFTDYGFGAANTGHPSDIAVAVGTSEQTDHYQLRASVAFERTELKAKYLLPVELNLIVPHDP